MQQLLDIVRVAMNEADVKPQEQDGTGMAVGDADAEADVDEGEEGWFEGDTELQDGPRWPGEDDLAEDGINDDDDD